MFSSRRSKVKQVLQRKEDVEDWVRINLNKMMCKGETESFHLLVHYPNGHRRLPRAPQGPSTT